MLRQLYSGKGDSHSQLSHNWYLTIQICFVLMTGVMKNRGLGMNVKKVLYEKVVVPTVMYGSES